MSEYLNNVIRATGGHAAFAENLEEEAALEKNPGDPCWEGYIQVGMKEKNGDMVPNCVPQDAAEIELEDVLFAVRKASTVDDIAPHLITYAINESKNFEAPRAVTYEQIKAVLASAETPEAAVTDVVSFIELAHYNDLYADAMKFASLLPTGHPRATNRGLVASALSEARAEWYVADPELSPEARTAIAEFFISEFGSVERKFAEVKLEALAASGEIEPLTAVGWKISFAKRSAMSKALAAVRRRDRYKRFAEEFGRLKGFFSGGKDGNFTAVGNMVGAVPNTNKFEVQYKGHSVIPDGIYEIDGDNVESVGAYLPQRVVKNLPKGKETFNPKDNASTVPLDQFLATRKDAPGGWDPIKNEQGKITGFKTSDGNKIMSVGKPDAAKAKEISEGDVPAFGSGENETFDPEGSIYTIKDGDGNVLAYAQDWATAQKANIYLGLGDDESSADAPEADKTEKLSLGEQYGLDKTGSDSYAFKPGSDDLKYEVFKDVSKGDWVVETTYDDGNKDEQRFKTDEEAFKYVAGEAGLDPELDPKVETPEEKPKANGDGIEYGKYTPEEVADGYQFGKPIDGVWTYDDASMLDNNDKQVDGVQIQVQEQKGTWYVEAEDGNGRVIDSKAFETPEDAFEYASWNAKTSWDQEWVDMEQDSKKDSNLDALAEKYNFDRTTNGFEREAGFGGTYEVYETQDGKGNLETRYDDGRQDTVQFESVEEALKWVSDYEGDNDGVQPDTSSDKSNEEYTPDEIALGYSFSKNSDGSYESLRETEDGGTVTVSQAKDGDWVVTELGGNGPDNWTEKEVGVHKNPTDAFEEANNLLASPSDFDEETAKSERDVDAPEAPTVSVGKNLEKLNTDEDGIELNDMFYVDNAIDDHKEQYFATDIMDVESELNYQLNRSTDDIAEYGDYMSGGAQGVVRQDEDGNWQVDVRFPEGDDIQRTFESQDEAVRFAAEEVAIFNTSNIPTALADINGFSKLDQEYKALETPDQALTFAGRLEEIADALENSRGPKKEIESLRGMADLIRENYGNGDDSQETAFYRMMAENSPLSSSINPSTDVNSVDAPEAPGSTDAKKSVKSNQDAVDKVMAGMLAAIESGDAMPWRKPFTDDPALAGAAVPRNPATKHVYSGVNSMVLRWVAGQKGYNDGRWMTYKNAQDLGGNVRKGEKGTFILAPRMIPKKDKDGKEVIGADGKPEKFIVFNAMAVFNVAQIDGLNLPDEKKNTDLVAKTPLEAQEFVIERYKKSMEALGLKVPEIHYTYVGQYGSHSSSPNWSPLMDKITLPTLEQFNSPEEIFDTLMHELAHSTGHANRLDRSDLTKDYGNPDGVARAKEELIAEISSAILGQMFGIENTLDNSAAYVQSWLQRLSNNPQEVISATKEAQKVVDYMLGIHLGDWSPVDGYKVSKGGSN